MNPKAPERTQSSDGPKTDWVDVVRTKVEALRFGSIQIIVHEGRVTQIESLEKPRLNSPSDESGTKQPWLNQLRQAPQLPATRSKRPTGAAEESESRTPTPVIARSRQVFRHPFPSPPISCHFHPQPEWAELPPQSPTLMSAIHRNTATRRFRNKFAFAMLAMVICGSASAGPVEPPAAPSSDLLTALKFDAEVRVRGEWTENVRDFNSDLNASDDDGWLITRTRLGVAWQPIDWLKLYAQGQDSMEAFSGRPHDTLGGANGNDHFDLRQAYLAIGDPESSPLTLTLGRQTLDFGSRRVVTDSPWSNYGRTFDAARLTWRANKDWTLDAVAGNIVTIEEDVFNTPDRASDLVGVFATGKLPGAQTIDFYAFHLDSEDSTIAPVRGDFWTIGARLFKKPAKDSPWDYELEAVLQTGHVFAKKKGLDLLAFGSQSTVGYTFLDALWNPRVSANFSYASGDQNAADGDQNRLQPLYASTHAMNGLLDSIGWANLLDPYIEVKIVPVENWTVSLQAHAFFRAETGDFVYRSNGSTPVRAPAGVNNDRYIGTELDLTVQTNLTKELEFLVGGGILFAGDYLASTGASDNAGTLYAQLTYRY